MLPCPHPMAGATQRGSVCEVGSTCLEDIRRVPVQSERGVEVGFAFASHEPTTPRGAGHCPGLPLCRGVAVVLLGRVDGVGAATETKVDLDELGSWREVDVLDATRLEQVPLGFESHERLVELAEHEREVPERPQRPHFAEAEAQRLSELQRLSRMLPAPLGSALTRLESGQSGQRSGELGALAGLARQPDRFVEVRFGLAPAVTSRLIPRDVREQERQHTDRGSAPRRRERSVPERFAGTCFAQPQWTHGRPSEQPWIVPQLLRTFEHADRIADGGRAASPSPVRTRAMPCVINVKKALRPVRGGRAKPVDPGGGLAHHGNVERIEGTVQGFGEHHRGALVVQCSGAVRGRQQDRLSRLNRPATRGDVTAQEVDRDLELRVR